MFETLRMPGFLAAIVKKAAAIPSAWRKIAWKIFLWSAIVGVILLPALSQLGYPVYSLEYVLVASASILCGALCFLVWQVKYLGSALLALLVCFALLLYFGSLLLDSNLAVCIFVPLVSAFVVFSFDHPRTALRIGGMAAAAQIAVTIFVRPAATVLLTETEVPRTDVPSVIHLLLDGHGGISSFPESAVGRAEIEQLEQMYLSRGFTVFRRAYTVDKFTQESVARLFNPPADSLPLDPKSRVSAYWLEKAEILTDASERRAPELTFTNYVDLRPAIQDIPNVSRVHLIRSFGGVTGPELSKMPVADRIWSLAAMVRAWFITEARSPMVAMFFKYTRFGQYWNAQFKPASWTNPLMGRRLLRNLIKRIECCGKRGSYIFAHLIHPHHPFIFDEKCRARPSRQWLNAMNHVAGELETLESWRKRWRRHYEQVVCAASDVGRLADGVRDHRELADTTIIVHSDHGARIRIRKFKERAVQGYDAAREAKDLFGAFLAVRIPGVLEGQIVDKPVRVDQVYRQLAKHDFRNLDLESLGPGPASPYPDWASDSVPPIEGD